MSAASHQRAENEGRGAHGFDQFVRSLGRCQTATADRGAMLGAPVAEFDFRPHRSQQLARSLDIAHLRNVFQDDRLVRQNGGSHGRQSGILGPADANCPQQRIAAADHEFIHI